eukprot:363466-Chlamydomonas_euryale.AAC.1
MLPLRRAFNKLETEHETSSKYANGQASDFSPLQADLYRAALALAQPGRFRKPASHSEAPPLLLPSRSAYAPSAPCPGPASLQVPVVPSRPCRGQHAQSDSKGHWRRNTLKTGACTRAGLRMQCLEKHWLTSAACACVRSLSFRGSTWMCTCGTVCPADAPSCAVWARCHRTKSVRVGVRVSVGVRAETRFSITISIKVGISIRVEGRSATLARGAAMRATRV